MTEALPDPGTDVYEYILTTIDSVPQLEALVLLWNSRPVKWTLEELASRLYIPDAEVQQLVRDLVRANLAMEWPGNPARFSFQAGSPERDELMFLVDAAYRRDLVRISTMIHNKASSPVREFAKAFRVKREKNG
jgi:hypothetical protein